MQQENRGLLVFLGILVVVLLIGPLLIGGTMGAGFAGPGRMGWGYVGGAPATTNGWLWGLGMALGGVMMLAFWGAVIVGIVLLVRWGLVFATAVIPESGVVARSGRHDRRGSTVEVERAGQHSRMADRTQLRHASRSKAAEQNCSFLRKVRTSRSASTDLISRRRKCGCWACRNGPPRSAALLVGSHVGSCRSALSRRK